MSVPSAGEDGSVTEQLATADVTDERVRDLPPADEPTATITPYRDGPLLVRGDFRLVDRRVLDAGMPNPFSSLIE